MYKLFWVDPLSFFMSKLKAGKKSKKPGQAEDDEEKDNLRQEIQRNTAVIEALERELCFYLFILL